MKAVLLQVLLLCLVFGHIELATVYGERDNFDDDVEILPLENQQARGQNLPRAQNPFDIETITTDIGGHSSPDNFFHQPFPFLGNSFFNAFGGFGLDLGSARIPWWRGENVCTDKVEDEEKSETEMTTDAPAAQSGESDVLDVQTPLFGHFQFNVNSCEERPNKRVCTKITNKDGRKKTLKITHQCCRGYGRPRNADVTTPCEKIEIKSLEAAGESMGAKEFVASAKNYGLEQIIADKKPVTIFMPRDDAFNNFNQQLARERNLVESKPDDALKNFFLRHIVSGSVSLDDIDNEKLLNSEGTALSFASPAKWGEGRQTSDLSGQKIRINAYHFPRSIAPEGIRYTANCVPIEKHDQQTEDGLVHSLNGVLPVVDKTVMEIIRTRADMSIMKTVLEKTQLSNLLEGEKPMTVFVPTDAAFEKLESNLRRALKEGKACAKNILKNHMLDLTFCSAASVAGAKTTAYNMLGEALRFNREKSEESNLVINGVAKVTEEDLMGTNGVVHVIDTVVPTESALPLSNMMQKLNLTLFEQLLQATGLQEQLEGMENITVFAPTDKALQSSQWAQMLEKQPEALRQNAELQEKLKYHIATPMMKTCDLTTEKMLPTENGASLRVNLYSNHALTHATVNCARLVHFDDESCGSVLHQVDKLLTPPKKNLLEMLEEKPAYSKFLELVRAVNLTHLLADNTKSLTLLVPKNEVFEEVEDWEKTVKKDEAELEALVKTHIIDDVVCCAGIIPTNWPFVRTIETLNKSQLHVSRDRRPKIENAGVTKCDNMATNGIIHEINDVVVVPKRVQARPPKQPLADIFGDIFF